MATPLRPLAGFACLALLWPLAAVAQDTSKSIVASAVREAGYECEKPKSVKPDRKASSADEKAWIVQCEQGTYRVKFTGDTGAKVEPVKGQ